MSGAAYASGASWAGWGHGCGRRSGQERLPEELDRVMRDLGAWVAEMTGGRPGGHSGHRGHRGGHRGRRGGPEAWAGGWFMPFGPRPGWGGGGPEWGGPPRRGPKARRGDVRAAILSVLTDADLNGYQVIQEIAERSDGAWKPSPGSVYPTLQQLEDEGLVVADAAEGRRTFRLTEEGRRYAEEHADELAAPWRVFSDADLEDSDEHELKPVIGQLMGALWQIMATGTPDQQAAARAALVDLRKTLFGILAEGDEEAPS